MNSSRGKNKNDGLKMSRQESFGSYRGSLKSKRALMEAAGD